MSVTTTAKFSKKLNIRSGDLKHPITIQSRALIPPSDVDFTEKYTDIATVWASVKINNNQEIFSKTNIDESITHFFYIRYLDDITIDNWILFDDNRYNIVAVKDIDFEKKFLELSTIFKGDISEESSKW